MTRDISEIRTSFERVLSALDRSLVHALPWMAYRHIELIQEGSTVDDQDREADEALYGHRYLLIQDEEQEGVTHRCALELVYEEPVESERLARVGEISITTSAEHFRRPSPSYWSHREKSTVLIQNLAGEGIKKILETRFQEARAWHPDENAKEE
jgi:hypothetical protein